MGLCAPSCGQSGQSPGSPTRRGGFWRDWALVAVLVPLCIVEVILRQDLPYRWLSFVVGLGGVAMLLWRRTHPLLAVATVFGATLVMDIPWVVRGGDPPGMYTMGYVLILAYALFRWGSGREALIGLGIMLVPATLALVLDFTSVSEAIGGFAVFFLSLAAGIAVRSRARERISRIDAARAREREALARDLHDTVAHHVSAMAIRAQAGLRDRGAHQTPRPTRCASSRPRRRARSPRCARWCGVLRQRRAGRARAHARGVADLDELAGRAPRGPPCRRGARTATSTTCRPSVGDRHLPPRPGVGHQRPPARPARDPHRGRGSPPTTTRCACG